MPMQTMRGQLPGYTAAADYRLKQYTLMYVSAAGVVTIGGAGAVACGVLINKPNIGEPADIFTLGHGQVLLGGTVAAGGVMKCDANGAAVAAATDKDHTIGYADVGGVAGDIIDFLCVPGSLAHA